MSAVSRPGFFRTGVTIACFWESGNRPCIRDALTIRMTSRSMNSRSRNVGTGSKEQDLIGEDMTIFRSSSCEHNLKHVNDDVALLITGGDGKSIVSERTRSILRAKKAVIPSAV